MTRKTEYFSPKADCKCQHIVVSQVKHCFPQERDWTCSIACLRSLLSAFSPDVPTEDELISQGGFRPGPHYAKELSALPLLSDYDVVTSVSFKGILELVENGAVAMLESSHNGGHWMVLLGYYPAMSGSDEDACLLLYDPYYDRVRIECLDEYLSMWADPDAAENGIKQECFILGEKHSIHEETVLERKVCMLQGHCTTLYVDPKISAKRNSPVEKYRRVKKSLFGF